MTQPVAQGAEAVEYLAASAELDGVSGAYFNGKIRPSCASGRHGPGEGWALAAVFTCRNLRTRQSAQERTCRGCGLKFTDPGGLDANG